MTVEGRRSFVKTAVVGGSALGVGAVAGWGVPAFVSSEAKIQENGGFMVEGVKIVPAYNNRFRTNVDTLPKLDVLAIENTVHFPTDGRTAEELGATIKVMPNSIDPKLVDKAVAENTIITFSGIAPTVIDQGKQYNFELERIKIARAGNYILGPGLALLGLKLNHAKSGFVKTIGAAVGLDGIYRTVKSWGSLPMDFVEASENPREQLAARCVRRGLGMLSNLNFLNYASFQDNLFKAQQITNAAYYLKNAGYVNPSIGLGYSTDKTGVEDIVGLGRDMVNFMFRTLYIDRFKAMLNPKDKMKGLTTRAIAHNGIGWVDIDVPFDKQLAGDMDIDITKFPNQ